MVISRHSPIIRRSKQSANIWLPLCCHPIFGDANQRKSGKRKNIKKLMINGELVIEWKKEKSTLFYFQAILEK